MLLKDFDKNDIAEDMDHGELQEIYSCYLEEVFEEIAVFQDVKLNGDGQHWNADILNIKNRERREVHIFEVKATRSDFINDKKWENYLDFCTHFWFVGGLGKNKEIMDRSLLPNFVGIIEIIPLHSFGWTLNQKEYLKKLYVDKPYMKQMPKDRIARDYYKEKYPDMFTTPYSILFIPKNLSINAFIKIERPASKITDLDDSTYMRLIEGILFNKFIYD